MKSLFVLHVAILFAACASSPRVPDPVTAETSVRHARPQLRDEKFDQQEFDPALAGCFAKADVRAEQDVANVTRNGEFIFEFWKAKKRLLTQFCGIDWKSPAELNPGIEYDSYGQPKLTPEEQKAVDAVVRANLVTRSEQIEYSWRDFSGGVFVVTRSANPLTVRHYELRGHDSTWEYVSVWVVEE
jgi:hypothetical protein